MSQVRGQFSSRFGFVMAAAGSAVGLGNIWGFPTQAASNGGGAFLLVYLILAFCLAYPVLMAELVIGRYSRGNPVTALRRISGKQWQKQIGSATGAYGIIIASLILSFYAIVGGWMFAHFTAPLAGLLGMHGVAEWLVGFSVPRNLMFAALFMAITSYVISRGVESGIERWSSRLMPVLLVILMLLIGYVLTLDGAMDGLHVYLVPDFSNALSPDLIIKALGSAFFSLSLGVGTMLIYGSYIDEYENLPFVGSMVTVIDVFIAVMAGFLIIPAMYVALHNGVEIFAASGELISEDTLIFTVLPALFDSMGSAGVIVSLVFFVLMSIAAITSSISMLEVPVSFVVEQTEMKRVKAAWLIGGAILLASVLIVLNFETMFGTVIALTTRYSQPLLGFMFCLYTGWVWHRDSILKELKKGCPELEQGIFWKIWPVYIKFFCPLIILLIFVKSIL